MAIFFNFSLTSSHLHPLEVENCDSNSRLVVDEDDNGKFRLDRVKAMLTNYRTTVCDDGTKLSQCWLDVSCLFSFNATSSSWLVSRHNIHIYTNVNANLCKRMKINVWC